MKVFSSCLFLLLILPAFVLSWKEQLSPTNDVCRLFKDGVKLRKPGTCSEGIICENFQSKPNIICPTDKPWYKLDGTCVAANPKDDYCKAPCDKKIKEPTFISDVKDCHHYYLCDGATELAYGICPYNQIFNQTLQMCTYEDQTKCEQLYEVCNLAPINTPFADEYNCHKYYQCNSKNALTSGTCPTGKYFDRQLGDCTNKSYVNCYQHPYPDEVCGNKKVALRNKFVDDQATCRGYFYCKDLGVGNPDLTPTWGQCSINEFFNPNLQACQDRNYVKCNEDRCDGRLEGEKEISGIQGCQYYLICGNGYTMEEAYCGDGKYFNVETKTCTTTKQSYAACS